MNRRRFLQFLGVASAVSMAPSIVVNLPTELAPEAGVIGEYFNYMNFSSFAVAQAIDEAVANAASQLSYQAGRSISELYQ